MTWTDPLRGLVTRCITRSSICGPSHCDQPVTAAKRTECSKAGNQFGVSPTYRNYCQPATGTASANCRQGTRTKVPSIYRSRTHDAVSSVTARPTGK